MVTIASTTVLTTARTTAACRRRSANTAVRKSAQNVMPTIPAWAPQMRASVVGSALAKCPTLKVTARTIVSEVTNIAVDVKAGRQRAESHNSNGNRSSTGTTVSHQISGNRKMTNPVVAATAMTAALASNNSRRGVRTRVKATSAIINGATVMMPIASDANQCRHVISAGTSGLCRNLYAVAPPTPEMAVPTIAAANSAAT